MLKKYRLIVITLVVIFIYNIIQLSPLVRVNKGDVPVISFNNQVITMSVKDNKSKLLQGIKAVDKEDGDLTKSIEIESLSPFLSDNQRTVNYIVFDSDDNITRASRTIQYTDYTAPVFSLNDQLSSSKYSVSELMKKVSARSCVDGDISSNITVMNVAVVDTGLLNIRLSVADSTNTTSYLNVKYYLEDDKEIEINLKKYIVYKNVGEVFDFRANIGDIVERLTLDNSLKPYVKVKVPDMSQPGIYEVEYTLNRSNGNKGKTTMVVVVE